MLASKDEVAMTWPFPTDSDDLYLDIEVEDVDEDVERSFYSVSLYVGDNKVAESKSLGRQ